MITEIAAGEVKSDQQALSDISDCVKKACCWSNPNMAITTNYFFEVIVLIFNHIMDILTKSKTEESTFFHPSLLQAVSKCKKSCNRGIND